MKATVSVSRQYVQSIQELHRDTSFGGDINIAEIWEEFERQSAEFTVVDWEESKRIAKKYHTRRKQCFQNCREIFLRGKENLQYYEGFVTTMIPHEHAWLVRSDGAVIDPTLCLLDDMNVADYFGVAVSARELIQKKNMFNPSWFDRIYESVNPGSNAAKRVTTPVKVPEKGKRKK